MILQFKSRSTNNTYLVVKILLVGDDKLGVVIINMY